MAWRLKALLMIFGLQCCKSKSIMHYNNHLSKLSVLHQLGLRVVLGMWRVMKMINVHEGKCEREIRSGGRQWEWKIWENKQIITGWRREALPCEQSSPIQPGKHWQEPSMGLQVPLLVQRQISAQALPYLPLGQTAKHTKTKHHFTKQPWSAYYHLHAKMRKFH